MFCCSGSRSVDVREAELPEKNAPENIEQEKGKQESGAVDAGTDAVNTKDKAVIDEAEANKACAEGEVSAAKVEQVDQEGSINDAVHNFVSSKVNSIRFLPTKNEAKSTEFSGDNSEQAIPQKYCWVQSLCSCFIVYCDMGGHTIPAFWDEHFGAGFTDHSSDDLLRISQQAMQKSLASEIRSLVESGVDENAEQETWTIAMGKVMLHNSKQAKGDGEVEIHKALAGEPDEACPCDALIWQSLVHKVDIFHHGEKAGSLNGESYTKEQLEKIFERPIEEDEIVGAKSDVKDE